RLHRRSEATRCRPGRRSGTDGRRARGLRPRRSLDGPPRGAAGVEADRPRSRAGRCGRGRSSECAPVSRRMQGGASGSPSLPAATSRSEPEPGASCYASRGNSPTRARVHPCRPARPQSRLGRLERKERTGGLGSGRQMDGCPRTKADSTRAAATISPTVNMREEHMSGLGGAVAIIGTGTIKFGENFHQSLTDMICEAVTLVLADAGIELGQLQAGWNTQFDPSWNFTSFRATREAAKAAYKMAGVTKPAKQIKVAECHDCFTIAEIVNYEELGFSEPGAGWRAVQAGETRLGGSLPVNKSGGLKSCGHPIGSSGIRMINNIHDQLLERAGKVQGKSADGGRAPQLG